MSVLIVTSLGDIVVDLDVKRAPAQSLNFLKLAKLKHYNYALISIQSNFSAQISPIVDKCLAAYTDNLPFFVPNNHKKLSHNKLGVLSFVTSTTQDLKCCKSAFFITLRDDLAYLDDTHSPFASIVEGIEFIDKLNETLCDDKNRPFIDIRILHTVILDDPFPDPPSNFRLPSRSPSPTPETLKDMRVDTSLVDAEKGLEVLEMERREEESRAKALTLELVGDLPFAEIKPPENVLFVCKLNPVTKEDDLELIFSRFGKILSCEIIKDQKTKDSLCYAFIEYDQKDAAEMAFLKMDGVLIDDKRVKVDFSQSVSKMNFTSSSSTSFNNGFAGLGNAYEKRTQYRGGDTTNDKDFELVFEKDGVLNQQKELVKIALEEKEVEENLERKNSLIARQADFRKQKGRQSEYDAPSNHKEKDYERGEDRQTDRRRSDDRRRVDDRQRDDRRHRDDDRRDDRRRDDYYSREKKDEESRKREYPKDNRDRSDVQKRQK